MPNVATILETLMIFLIPLGVLGLKWLIQQQVGKARLDSGIDLFVFLTSLDLAYLASGNSTISRINPHFATMYSALFVILLIVSLFLLVYAARVQSLVDKFFRRGRHYPLGEVCLCLFFAMVSIGFHCIVLLGGHGELHCPCS
jgi:uncharacterized membrane protein YidH (DUF202 family)